MRSTYEKGLRLDRQIDGRSVERLLINLGIILAFLTTASAVQLALGGKFLAGPWLWISPAILFVACMGTAFRMIRADIQMVASPIFWVLLASGVYWGFGPLIFTFGDRSAIEQINTAYHIGSSELFLTNLLNSVGMFALVVGLAVGRRLVGRLPHDWMRRSEGLDPLRVAGVLACVGLTAKLAMVLPFAFGLIGTQSSMLLQMQVLSKAALIILAYLSVTRGGKATAWLVLLFAIEFLTAGVLASKMAILEVVIAMLVGRALAVRKPSTVVKGFVVMGLLQVVLQPVVSGYRMMDRSTGGGYASSVVATGALMAQSLSNLMHGVNAAQAENSQGWWSRLCYAPQQAFVMQEYDSGRPGSPWGDLAMAFIPRVLWHDKPLITPGKNFSILITGNENNNDAPGVLGEGYWYGGWLGLLTVGFYAGMFLGGADRVSAEVISRRAWILMPLVSIGLTSGFRIDDWFSTGYLFGPVYYICFAGIMFYFSALLQRNLRLPSH